jgi:preprotein translocase subunit SecE
MVKNLKKPEIKVGFFQDIVAEMKKVTWPTKDNTMRLTTVVIVISLIIGLYIGIIDIALASGLDYLTK